MDDGLIEQRLRAYRGGNCEYRALMDEAADTIERLRSDNRKLLGWLYEACDGFPVSQEAFDAVSADIETIEAIRSCSDHEGISLDEFRAKVLVKIDAALTTVPLGEGE